MAHLVIVNREHGLIRHLVTKCTSHRVASLPVGDLLCTYDAGGCSWIMERKRADDFAASIQDGRWREQTGRLMASGHRVVFMIEGDLRQQHVWAHGFRDRQREPQRLMLLQDAGRCGNGVLRGSFGE